MNTQTSAGTTAVTEQELTDLGPNDFEAALTTQEVEYERAQDARWAAKRRTALVALSWSKTQLVERFGDGYGQATLLDLVEDISCWRDHLNKQVELADMAAARLAVVASAVIHCDAKVA